MCESEKLYKIKPLEWTKEKGWEYDDWYSISYSASTSTCSFSVNLDSRKDEEDGLFYTECTWSYCFDEYYDESHGDCKSIKHGMKLMQKYWESRLSKDLELVYDAT